LGGEKEREREGERVGGGGKTFLKTKNKQREKNIQWH